MPGRTSKQESLPPAWWATPGSTATWHGAMPSTTAGFRGRDFRHRLARSSTLGGQAVYLQNAVSKEILEQEFSPVSSPVEPCAKNFANGADLIKVVVDAGAGPTWQFRYLSPEDAKAAVEGAHRLA
jgi:hypothetical protein